MIIFSHVFIKQTHEKIQRIGTFKHFLRRKKKKKKQNLETLPNKKIKTRKKKEGNAEPLALHPSCAGSLRFFSAGVWTFAIDAADPQRAGAWQGKNRSRMRFLSYGTVTCGQVFPEGLEWLSPVSGVLTSSAQAVIISPLSGRCPPPSTCTHDYFWNPHNLNPPAAA